jgi:hypothetical protein
MKMEHINIISKEAIMAVPSWMGLTASAIAIGIMSTTFIYWSIVKDVNKVIKYELILGVISLALVFSWSIISSIFFKEPTGRYKYEATIDKDKISVSEYEEFIEEYNPTIQGEIYYWEE